MPDEQRLREFPPIFDGHEDFIYQIMHGRSEDLIEGRRRRDFLADGSAPAEGDAPESHVDVPRALRGGLGGSFTSIFLTNEEADIDPQAHAMRCLNALLGIVDRSEGRVRLCRTVAEIEQAFDADAFASVIAFEGADPISSSLKELRVYYEVGLRCLAPTWSRSTIFAHGVAFRGNLPATGLTEKGRELVAECNRLGILLDVSHINAEGFWDMLGESVHPVIATHSSVKAISPHVRNLDDDQIRALALQGGTIGINFSNSFLLPDMARDGDAPLDTLLDHFDHVVNVVGDEHVSFGTDFDGTSVPSAVRDASYLPVVLRGLKQRGYSDDSLERICNGNFLRVAREVWGA